LVQKKTYTGGGTVSRNSTAILAAALWLAASCAAQAAGLGRLTVLSPLGQPLHGEIEIVSLQPGEADGLSARLAPEEAFRQAGIEPSPALIGLRFAIERRNGRPVLKVTTSQPINEPFVELLVELQWNTGRLVREYTFLLDPPEYKGPQAIAAAPAKPAPAPIAKPLPPTAEEARPAEPQSKPAPVVREEQPAPAPVPAPPAAEAKAPEAKEEAKDKPAAARQHEVRQGDTLGAIARQSLPPGVSLNQMLIAIYRANQDAFIRENINLVRAGRILNIPDAETIGTMNAEEANTLVLAHRGEWEEYRSRLAAVPAPAEAAPGQPAVSGTIEAKPQPTPPAPTPDQLRLSKADPQKPGAADTRAAKGDDAAARERALKEAQSRVTDLERNVADLQKLLELKNQQLAELEKKAAAAKPAPASPAAPSSSVAPIPGPAKPAAPAPETKKAEAPKPAAEAPKPAPEAAKPAAPAITPAPTPVPGPAAPAPAPEAKKADPAPKPKPKAAPPPPPPPPSLLDEFLENPIALLGLGVILLILLVYGLWAWRRKKATQAKFQDSVLGAAGGNEPAFAAGAAAGGAVSEASVNQPVAGMEGEEVDPIAEADVYMAYGRDAQAEEILREALHKDASRIPVHAKLLEIYAKRRDTAAFEQTALKLKALTGGTGAEWEKATALGRSIDPDNGLYGGSGSAGGAGAGAFGAAIAADGGGRRGSGPRFRPWRRDLPGYQYARRHARPAKHGRLDDCRGLRSRGGYAASGGRQGQERLHARRHARARRQGARAFPRGTRLRPEPRRRRKEARRRCRAGARKPRTGARAERRARFRPEPGSRRKEFGGGEDRCAHGSFRDQPGPGHARRGLGRRRRLEQRSQVAGSRHQARSREGVRGNGRQGWRARAAQRGDERRRRLAEGPGRAAAYEARLEH
jgi:pilus assembly protein FimV